MKLTKVGKIVLVLLILISVIGIIVYMKLNENKDIHSIISNDFYDIKIDFEKTNIKALNNKVVDYINGKENEFIETIDESGKVQSSKYNLIINTNTNEYNNLISIHVLTFYFTGGAHYVREDVTYVYNTIEKKYINFNDLLKSGSEELIKNIVLKYLYKYGEEKKIVFNDWQVEEGTKITNKNYENFYFDNNGLNIIFPPYQVASWADGEVKITIPFEDLETILKPEYMGETIDTSIDINKPTERNLDNFKDKKLIAFTFDDGPNTTTTNRLLDGIKEYNAKVTFFVLGSRVNNHQEVLKRAYEEENQIGTHTYNHLNLFLLSDSKITEEINKTDEAIKNIIGVYPEVLRPPYGNINDNIKKLSSKYIINWNVDTEDWKLKDRNLIKDNILKNARDGAIVLLHDIYTESVEGSLLAMEELEKEGYAFVTISEMAKLKGVTLDYNKTYFNF